MKNRSVIFCLLLLFLISPLFSVEEEQKKELAPKYREWLDLVEYIISPVEKEVFSKITTDRDRDIFIEAFWKQRDPTEGTPQNEYREEHIRRVNHANKYYGRGTTRPGWKTDMGRYYIILGQPSSIDREENTAYIVPTQVWYYYGDPKLGLPTYFALVFFKRGGYGEYRLYNPTSDGPMALMENPEEHGLDYTDYKQQYQKMYELAPTLARVSLTNIPGQIPYNYTPSLRTNIVLSKIEESPVKKVKTTYASHFLNYKGYVTTDYLTNFVESDVQIGFSRNRELGMNLVHFSMVPEKISIDYYEPNDQYYCNYSLNVSLRKGEEIVYQYSKDFPFYFTHDRIPNVRASGISIQDSFPVAEGDYTLSILIQNSVAKEFSVIEREISIPATDNVQILDAFLGYQYEDNQAFSHFPYKIGTKKIFVDPKNTFSMDDQPVLFFNIINVGESLWESGKARVIIKGTKKMNPVEKILSIDLRSVLFARTLDIFQPLPIDELVPDYYEISLTLEGGESEVLDSKRLSLIVSPQVQVAHPIALYKIFSLSNRFLYFYNVAYQYDKLGETNKAEAAYEQAYRLKPDYREGLLGYAHFLIRAKKFQKSLELIKKIGEDENLKFDYHLIKGQAYLGMENYSEALDSLLEGNALYDSDVRLLNSLGFCYYKIGEKAEALEALKASLRLNSEQPKIQALIQEIEKNNK